MPVNCKHQATSFGFSDFPFLSTFMLAFFLAASYKSTQAISQNFFFFLEKNPTKLQTWWKEHNLHFILQGETKGLADVEKYN